jgi:hypothetical protein
MIAAMMRPPTAPKPRIGAQALVITADGALKSRPTNRPTTQRGPVEIDHADDKPDSEPIEQCGRERGALIRELQRKHQAHGENPEGETGNDAEQHVGHSLM